MNTRKVLVAFDSRTICSLMRKRFEEIKYEVIECRDGLSALEAVYTQAPDAVIASYDLPVINGFSLARIIKNTPFLANIAVITCTTEESSVLEFWNENSKGDVVFTITENNGEELVMQVKVLCDKLKNNFTPREAPDRNTLAKDVISAYERELFQLYIVQGAFYSSSGDFTTENILQRMANQLLGVHNYDALCIILNDDPLIEFTQKADFISESDMDDFIQICRSDFSSTVTNRKEYNWQTARKEHNFFKKEEHRGAKLKSYEFFPRESSSSESTSLSFTNFSDRGIPFTLHVGSTSSDAFNVRTSNRLKFFVQVYSLLFQKVIEFKKVRTAEEKIHNAFSRFLPPKVINDIIAGQDSLGSDQGEKRQVAILIADIRGFTTISELTEPEKVVEFLNSYFSVMGQVIKKHGGTIDKFMGDAIMALFGAPESYEDNGRRAAEAALDMIDALKTVDTSLLNIPQGHSFQIGIGIHYGKPIVGSIGSQEKREYTVIGDDVNIASRIEGLTKLYGTPVIISDSVKRDMDAHKGDEKEVLLRHLDNVKVKGKSIAVEIYELTRDTKKYSHEFLENYHKAINQYRIGNFDGATEYFNIAHTLCPADRASELLYERSKKFLNERPADWDGAIALTTK